MFQKLTIPALVVMFLFLGQYSQAVEVQLQGAIINTSKATEQIEKFLKNNPFPDSAYNVEIEKNISIVESDQLELTFKLIPNPKYFEALRNVIEEAFGYERVNSRWIGIEIADAITEMRGMSRSVVRVLNVIPDSPAMRSGIEKGDIIQKFNGTYLGERDPVEEFRDMLNESKIGEKITLTVIKSYPSLPVTYNVEVSENSEQKILKRKTPITNGESTIQLLGEKYSMPRQVAQKISNFFNKDRNSFYPTFPLSIRYELKDSAGNSLQAFDEEYTGRTFEDNLDKVWIERGSEKIEHVYIRLTSTPEQIKQIVASVANMQIDKERKALAQRQREEEEKRDATERAKLEKEEQERIKQEKEVERQRQVKLKKYLPQCNGKIMSLIEFYRSNNPYADQGKCVEIEAIAFQNTSATSGLFKYSDSLQALVYINFDSPFRGRYVKGIAKILGVKEYQTNLGGHNSVPHLKMIKIDATQ